MQYSQKEISQLKHSYGMAIEHTSLSLLIGNRKVSVLFGESLQMDSFFH